MALQGSNKGQASLHHWITSPTTEAEWTAVLCENTRAKTHPRTTAHDMDLSPQRGDKQIEPLQTDHTTQRENV